MWAATNASKTGKKPGAPEAVVIFLDPFDDSHRKEIELFWVIVSEIWGQETTQKDTEITVTDQLYMKKIIAAE